MKDVREFHRWNNMEVEIIKKYVAFNKVKIHVINNNEIIIVDICTLQKVREGAISIQCLEG